MQRWKIGNSEQFIVFKITGFQTNSKGKLLYIFQRFNLPLQWHSVATVGFSLWHCDLILALNFTLEMRIPDRSSKCLDQSFDCMSVMKTNS